MSSRVFTLTHNPTLSWSINQQPSWVEDTKLGVPIDGQWSVGIREGIDPGDVDSLLHHKDPLSNAREARKVDPIKDLVSLYENSHVMVHRYLPILTIPQLRRMIRKNA